MSRFAEERAAWVRVAAGLQGFIDPPAVTSLTTWLAGCLEFETVLPPHPASFSLEEDGHALIRLPVCADPNQEALQRLEEAAHFLVSRGEQAAYFGRSDDAERMNRWAETRDELETQRFMDALRLPWELVRRYRDQQLLQWDSGCDAETVERRMRQLRTDHYVFREVPAWSAWHHYEVRFFGSGVRQWIRVIPKGWKGAWFDVPLEWGSLLGTRWQVNADLMALTVDEFRLKYSAEQIRRGESAQLTAEQVLSERSKRKRIRRFGQGGIYGRGLFDEEDHA